ncbi:hypothetical protein NUW58_g7113 [Xylaria curta]|uniref:Uncharacterized protein n=1 Tax=Xylaria curta TaxID=42375 RepID=A0ACC1NMY2_9PEZI|nr:hypothetical protein NUW58_g7113 [Xylaria curta]
MLRFSNDQKKGLASLAKIDAGNASVAQDSGVDSAVDMTFPESVTQDAASSDGSSSTEVSDSTAGPRHLVFVQAMPYSPQQLMLMGETLAQARRERTFPPTTTPSYNIQALIDDYEDLQRLNIAREAEGNINNHAFSPEITRMYIEIQRRIQDRDVTHGEVAADANVRARISGFANSAGAETGLYNLMRHAVQSVLRLNHLSPEADSNIINAAASRVIAEVRNTVQGQASRGDHGVNADNMDAVMENVFNAIEHSLGNHVSEQATITEAQRAQLNSLNNVTDAQHAQLNSLNNATADQRALNDDQRALNDAHNMQVSAIASHVGAIDNHVHAMGNNVNAMSTLVNSTNGNVTALGSNIVSLQTVVNMLPQMISNAVRDVVQEMLPGIIGPAVEQAFEGAISNELIERLYTFVNAVQEARAQVEALGNEHRQATTKTGKGGWFSKMFKKH